MIAIDESVAALMVSAADPKIELIVAVIVADPVAIPVARPFVGIVLDTVATPEFEVVQTTLEVTSWVDESENVAVATKSRVALTPIE